MAPRPRGSRSDCSLTCALALALAGCTGAMPEGESGETGTTTATDTTSDAPADSGEIPGDLVFCAHVAGVEGYTLQAVNADGSGAMDLTARTTRRARFLQWSGDGRYLAWADAVYVGEGDLSHNEDWRLKMLGPGASSEPLAGEGLLDVGRTLWAPVGASLATSFDRAGVDPEMTAHSLRTIEGDGALAVLMDRDDAERVSVIEWAADGKTLAYQTRVPVVIPGGTVTIAAADGSSAKDLSAALAPALVDGWALAPNGQRVAIVVEAAGEFTLYLVDKDGATYEVLDTDPTDIYHPQWSPDGSYLSYSRRGWPNEELVIREIDGGNPQVVTGASGIVWWSPTASELVYTLNDPQQMLLLDVVLGESLLLAGDVIPRAWSPDGDHFMAIEGGAVGAAFVYDRQAALVLEIPEAFRTPTWSPDSRLLATATFSGSDLGVWIYPLDGGPRVGLGLGDFPIWRPLNGVQEPLWVECY